MNSPHPYSHLRRALPLLLGVLLASNVHAQTVAPQPATPASPANPPLNPATKTAAKPDEEVLELSPFTVNASEDVGYKAQNTLAGSRLNSSLKDTPGVLDVLTSEFLSDIGVVNLEDALAYSANFAVDNGDFDSQGVINTVFPGSQANSSFRTRGLGGTVARNYLQTDFRPSFYTIERIDNSSGPNAILFGLGSAGGVANVSTKQAKLNKDSHSVELRYDSYGSERATIDFNQVLIRQTLGLRVNAVTERANKYRANFADNRDGMQLAGKWQVNDRTEIRVEYEIEHVTGSVAYPGPHLEQVTNWIALGSGVATLPTNWESLTDAARRLISTPLGLTTNSAGLSPVVVQQPNGQAYIINQATAISTSTAVGGTNSQSINPLVFSPQGNINGPGGRKGVDRQIFSIAADHKLANNLYLNLSAARENGDADTYQAFANGAASGAVIQVDANSTIPNATQIASLAGPALETNASGQTINPYVGQYYTQTRWLHRTQSNKRSIAQATLAYEVKFGEWLGSHRMVATTSYQETANGSENFRDSWLGAPFNNDPVNTNNGVTRRRYASPLDADNFHVPDWRDFPTLTWNHPTRGLITTGWVTEGENLRNAHQFAYLGALQSRLLKDRLILTGGYRQDDITDYVFGQKLTFPTGFETSTGIKVLDRSNVAKSNTRGSTHSLGAVIHVIDNFVSIYANTSTNFGPPRGTTVGPDAVIGPTTKGKGLDVGLKFTLLDNKINLDVGYFDTSSNNVTEVLNLNLRTADSIPGAYNAVFTALRTPLGASPLFNPADPAAVEALKAAYPLLRPTFNATGDLLDQASRGYEVRLIANPVRGLNIRATFSKTSRDRENLYQFTIPMAAQLRTYIGDLQAQNPGVNISSLVATTETTTTIGQSLDNLDNRLDLATDSNNNNFGAGATSFNIVARYDLPGRLKGWSTTLTSSYKAGAYTGIYEVREGGLSTGTLIDTVPLFGKSTMDYGFGLRYRTKVSWLRKTSLTIQANVFNLFDQTEPIIRRASRIIVAPGAPTPSAVDAATKSYFLREPRSWAISAKFDF